MCAWQDVVGLSHPASTTQPPPYAPPPLLPCRGSEGVARRAFHPSRGRTGSASLSGGSTTVCLRTRQRLRRRCASYVQAQAATAVVAKARGYPPSLPPVPFKHGLPNADQVLAGIHRRRSGAGYQGEGVPREKYNGSRSCHHGGILLGDVSEGPSSRKGSE